MRKSNTGKAIGVPRYIDKLGRVVIPKFFRESLGIEIDTPLEIFATREGDLIIKKIKE